MEQMWRAADQAIQAAESKHDSLQQLLAAAEQRIQAAESTHDALRQQLQAAERGIQTADSKQSVMEQTLHAAEQRIQAADTKHNAMEQMLQAAEQKILETEQKLADADRENKTSAMHLKTRAERLTAEWDEIKRAFAEQATRRENIEVSIGELGQDVGGLKGQLSELLTGPFEKLESVDVAMKSHRRILLISMAACILTLLAVGYMQLGKPGWPIFAP
jgi:chromosome segregation ATPase